MSRDYLWGTKRDKNSQTASPSKYPQGYFKDKPCGKCGNTFSPNAPSEKYCSDECAKWVYTDNYLKRNYGVGKAEYDKMYSEQQGLCWIYGGEGFTMHKNVEGSAKLVVDHCHNTNEVRGLLCHNCNRALGLFQDNVDNLNKAVEYLTKEETQNGT